MIEFISKLLSPKSYFGDLVACFLLAIVVYLIGFLFIFLTEVTSGATGAGIFTVYYVILFPIFLIPAAFLLFIILALNRYLKNKKKDFNKPSD